MQIVKSEIRDKNMYICARDDIPCNPSGPATNITSSSHTPSMRESPVFPVWRSTPQLRWRQLRIKARSNRCTNNCRSNQVHRENALIRQTCIQYCILGNMAQLIGLHSGHSGHQIPTRYAALPIPSLLCGSAQMRCQQARQPFLARCETIIRTLRCKCGEHCFKDNDAAFPFASRPPILYRGPVNMS